VVIDDNDDEIEEVDTTSSKSKSKEEMDEKKKKQLRRSEMARLKNESIRLIEDNKSVFSVFSSGN
jgi:hypothetical protein